MDAVDWERFDLHQLTHELRGKVGGEDGEKMVWAFEEALRAARADQTLLGYLLVAVVCLLARLDGSTPRSVLEIFFRRSITDEDWRENYLPLFS